MTPSFRKYNYALYFQSTNNPKLLLYPTSLIISMNFTKAFIDFSQNIQIRLLGIFRH